jgi:hypothetical protein
MSFAISVSDHGPEEALQQYLQFRRAKEKFDKNAELLKKDLMSFLEHNGEKDDRKSSFYWLEEPNEDVQGIKRECRVSQSLDQEAALELIHKYGLEDECLETITVINEDGLLAANFAGVIPDDEVKALYQEKESFAFILLKGN